jgi:hypothetical protein
MRVQEAKIVVTCVCEKCGKVHQGVELKLGHGKENDTYYGRVECCEEKFVVSSRPKYMDIGVAGEP